MGLYHEWKGCLWEDGGIIVHVCCQDPLLTLMTGGGHEMAFTVLAHIQVIAERSESQVFDDEYKKFYCRYFPMLLQQVLHNKRSSLRC